MPCDVTGNSAAVPKVAGVVVFNQGDQRACVYISTNRHGNIAARPNLAAPVLYLHCKRTLRGSARCGYVAIKREIYIPAGADVSSIKITKKPAAVDDEGVKAMTRPARIRNV